MVKLPSNIATAIIIPIVIGCTVTLLTGCGVVTGRPAIVERSITLPQSSGPRPCIDTLGAAKYPKALRVIPKHFGIGGFAKTFGDFFPTAKKELEQGREFIRVNLLWSDSHSYGDKDISFIRMESQRYDTLCQRFPGRIEIAPFTEHNLTNADKYLKIVADAAPHCGKPVNSVWKGSFTKNPAYKNEAHGSHKPPKIPGVSYNWSDDGRSSVDTNFPDSIKLHSRADLVCAWHPCNNGKYSMKDSTPRPQRKGWCSEDMLRSLVYLFTDKGYTSLPKNYISKSHSDNHSYLGKPDPRGDKLLIIAPIQANEVILKKQGKKVGTLPYYAPFDGGGYRYYAPQMGWKYGPGLDVFINNKKRGTINGGHRENAYRD